VFPNVEVRHLHAVIALGEELNFTEGSTKSRMTMPTAPSPWNWKFQRRVSCLAKRTGAAAVPIFLAFDGLLCAPGITCPRKIIGQDREEDSN